MVATHANFESNVLDSNIWVVDLETGEGSHNAKTPSLIQHGEEDVRVPLSQGTAFYRALKLNGVNVEMVIYPREPHGLREPKHIRDAMERNLQWFEHWLSDGGPTSEP